MADAEIHARLVATDGTVAGDGFAFCDVEAGATTEYIVEVQGDEALNASGESVECSVSVVGLPTQWCTLASRRVRLQADIPTEVLLVIHPPQTDRDHPPAIYPFSVVVTAAPGLVTTLPGRVRVLPPAFLAKRSRFQEYLPDIFDDSAGVADLLGKASLAVDATATPMEYVSPSSGFTSRFLKIFQSVFDPVEDQVDTLDLLLDPGLTPARYLPWLASWIDVPFDPDLPESRQRELIRRGVELDRWKGTRQGLAEALRIRLGGRPLIVENFDGMRLGQDAMLGANTILGWPRDGSICVTLVQDANSPIDREKAARIVDELKPANVGQLIRVVDAPVGVNGGNRGASAG